MLTEKEFFEQREERVKIFKNCGIYIIRNVINDNIYVGGVLFKMPFKTLGETIFRGNASVTNGQFEFGF